MTETFPYATVTTPTHVYRQATVVITDEGVTVKDATTGDELASLVADVQPAYNHRGKRIPKDWTAEAEDGTVWSIHKECKCRGRRTMVTEL